MLQGILNDLAYCMYNNLCAIASRIGRETIFTERYHPVDFSFIKLTGHLCVPTHFFYIRYQEEWLPICVRQQYNITSL